MDLDQFNEQPSEIIRHGSIDFLIPDVKMLDEFYRRRMISIGDIHGEINGFADSDECAPRFPKSTPARNVVIQHQTNAIVHSQHPSITSLQHGQLRAHVEDAKPSQNFDNNIQKFPTLPLYDTDLSDHCEASSKLLQEKYDYDENDYGACFNNETTSFAAEFDEVYADFEANIARDAADTTHVEEPKMYSRLTDVTSWTTFFADQEPRSPGWPISSDHGGLDDRTGSVLIFDLENMSEDEEVIILTDEDDQGTSFREPPSEEWQSKQDPLFLKNRSVRGFPGRFSMFQPEQISWLGGEKTSHTFGLTHHPNGRIINKAFVRDPLHQVTSLDEAHIMHDTVLSTTIRLAEVTAARLEPLKQMRTMEERILRREIHRECALARLEGVSVGYFRYFAGHMTAEEYLAARICVCWSDCFCNKLCTRFGDMLCPCSDNLELCD